MSGPSLRLEPLPDLESAREEWSELAARGGNIFATWEWAATWWRHFGRGRELRITACRGSDGKPVAILPLYRSSLGPLRLIRFIGHGPGDRLGPVASAADRAAAGGALRRLLGDRRERWDLFLAEQLPGEGWSGLLGGRTLRREPAPTLLIEGTSWEDFLRSRSANLRSRVRRDERRLSREHEVRYRLVRERAELGPALDTLFRLHEARWGERGSGAFSGARGAFHRDFASTALERGWLRLWSLEVDGQAVAMWHGFRFDDVEHYYQSGRDPAWDRCSVGQLLLVHTIREAFSDGMREYDFLRGGEAYKSRFATHHPELESVIVSQGLVGRASTAGILLARRAPPRARRALRRLAG